MYINVLTDDDGNIGYHVRFKGLNRSSIEYFCKERGWNIVDFYIGLKKGEAYCVDICKGGKDKFEFGKYGVRTRDSFDRIVCFDNDKKAKKEKVKKLRDEVRKLKKEVEDLKKLHQ